MTVRGGLKWVGRWGIYALGAAVMLTGCEFNGWQRYPRLQQSAGKPVTRVLMIGDSLTYYNDLPGLLGQMSSREASPIYIEQITGPLQSLQFHWDTGAAKRVREGHWDFVILQDYSRKPVTDPEGSLKSFRLFDEDIRRAGGKTIIFQNWTRRGMQDEYGALFRSYQRIMSDTHGLFAPIGAAWRELGERRPDVELLMDDRHPTNAGTYLAACVLYDVIYHKKSGDLAGDLPGPTLPESLKQVMRKIADDAVAQANERRSEIGG